MTIESAYTAALRSDLCAKGISLDRLTIQADDTRVVLSGEVGTFYEVQVIQNTIATHFRNRQICNNLTVMRPRHAREDASRLDSHGSEIHELRNRLNTLSLGLQVVEKLLESNSHDEAAVSIRQLIEFGNRANDAPHICASSAIVQRRVLIVEDDPNQCLLLSGMLRHLGHQVSCARGLATMNNILAFQGLPDVAIVDMLLGDSDGAQVVHALRSMPNGDAVKVVALSATHHSILGLQMNANSINTWLPKPVNIEHLLAEIASCGP